jgi:hypothetical protein
MQNDRTERKGDGKNATETSEESCAQKRKTGRKSKAGKKRKLANLRSE